MNSLKTFLIGISVAFGLPWLILIIGPAAEMADLGQVAYEDGVEGAEVPEWPPVLRGLAKRGSEVYTANGCAYCHTQMVRPTYAGSDMWRPGWGGREEDELARETLPWDYLGEERAPLGIMRLGPDLSNVGWRIQDADWHHEHLYDPRSVVPKSLMPSASHLYKKEKIIGVPVENAVAVDLEKGIQVLPTEDADALVAYLLSLRKDYLVPSTVSAAN